MGIKPQVRAKLYERKVGGCLGRVNKILLMNVAMILTDTHPFIIPFGTLRYS